MFGNLFSKAPEAISSAVLAEEAENDARIKRAQAEAVAAEEMKVRSEIQIQTMKRIAAAFEPSYTGASTTSRNMRGWLPEAWSGDGDTLDSLEMLRARSRDLYRNDALASSALNSKNTCVIGTGLVLSSQPAAAMLGWNTEAAQEWARNVENEFALWADNSDCDATRHSDFYGLQSLVFLSTLLSGDCFTLMPYIPRRGRLYDLRLRVIEADRCSNANDGPDKWSCAGGIERDGSGAPTAYWFRQSHPGTPFVDDPNYNRWIKVPAFGARTGRRNVLHHFVRSRPETSRGVPILAPIMELCKQHARYRDAEVSAAVLNAFLAIFITQKAPESTGFGDQIGRPGINLQPARADKKEIKIGGAAVVSLNPGEEIDSINPKHPTDQFGSFVNSLFEQIGASLGVPKEILLKSFQASYSASRAALLEAWRHFNECRSWMISSFCQPVYEEWMAEAVLRGRIQAPGFFNDPAKRYAYCYAAWVGPGMGQINPKDEADALKTLVDDLGILSRTEARAEYDGGDYIATLAQKAWEIGLLKKYGMEPAPPRQKVPETVPRGKNDDE